MWLVFNAIVLWLACKGSASLVNALHCVVIDIVSVHCQNLMFWHVKESHVEFCYDNLCLGDFPWHTVSSLCYDCFNRDEPAVMLCAFFKGGGSAAKWLGCWTDLNSGDPDQLQVTL